jgi:hypothetical protein
MAQLSKQAYEAKAQYASRSNSENAEIMQEAGASQELIDSILRIVSIRHDIHSGSRSSLFNTESSDFDSKWKMINELQEFVSESILDEFNSPLDTDWSMGLVDEEDFDSYQDFSEKSILEISNKIEKLNTLVEKKLQEIDLKFSTSWTPSGASRIF